MIYLVNAGCRQAGPKILSDRSARVSRCCKHLRCGLEAQGARRHPAARLGVPPEGAATTNGAARQFASVALRAPSAPCLATSRHPSNSSSEKIIQGASLLAILPPIASKLAPTGSKPMPIASKLAPTGPAPTPIASKLAPTGPEPPPIASKLAPTEPEPTPITTIIPNK
jgi:hypothetical protein